MKKSKKVWFLIALLIALVLIIVFLISGCKSEGSQVIATNQTEIQAVPVVIEEPVKEEFTVKSKRFSYQNYIMTVTDYTSYTVVDYPSVVLESDVLDFFGFELERYPYLSGYCFYEFKNGSVVFTYPEYITGIDYADTLAEEILIYLQSIPEEPIIIEEVKQEPVRETLEEKLPVSKPEPFIQQPVTEPAYTEETKKEQKRELDISVIASPFAFQKVNYDDNIPSFRNSSYGAGVGVRVSYSFNQKFSIGTDIQYEFHTFKNFHNYHDLKVNTRFRVLFIPLSKDNKFTLNFSMGVGADFVFRDDKDYGCYPLFICTGLDFEYRADKKLSFMTGIDLSLTWQTGSNVLHLTPFIGCTYHFDLGDRR